LTLLVSGLIGITCGWNNVALVAAGVSYPDVIFSVEGERDRKSKRRSIPRQ
jgi:hypothetical protein